MSFSLLVVVVVVDVVVVDVVAVGIGFAAVINETKSCTLRRVIVTFAGKNVVFEILGAVVVTVVPNNLGVSIRGAVAVTVIIAFLFLVVVVKLARIRRSSGKDRQVNGIGASWSSGFYISKHNNILCHFYYNTKW